MGMEEKVEEKHKLQFIVPINCKVKFAVGK